MPPLSLEESPMASVAKFSLLILALLVCVGGVIGYKKAGSKASLIMGTASAALLAVAFVIATQAPSTGLLVGLVISLMLSAVFGVRLKKTGKFMPAGLLLALCLVELAVLLVTLMAR